MKRAPHVETIIAPVIATPVDVLRRLQPSRKGVKTRLAGYPTEVLTAAIAAEHQAADARPIFIEMLEAEIERRHKENPKAMDTAITTTSPDAPAADFLSIAAASEHRWIPLDDLRPSPLNHRKHFDAKKMEELTANVRVQGVIVPILARPLGEGVYEIVAGERRYRAAKGAGLPSMPAIVRELTDAQALELQVIENNQREDVHPLEEAEGYEALMKCAGYNVDEIAAKVGKSRAYVYARLKLTSLGEVGRAAFYEGKLDPSRALLLARIPIEELQEKALAEILKPHDWNDTPMSYREAAEHIQYDYMLRLKGAPFKTSDAELVPAAGSCAACPKRTGAQPELFADLEVKDDMCTDPKCFAAKRDAHLEQMGEIARAKGKDVVKPRAKGYVELDARVPGDSQYRTYRDFLGSKAPAAALMPKVEQDKPQLVEVVKKADVQDLVKKKLEKQRAGYAGGGQRDWQKEREEAAEWSRKLFTHIVAAIPVTPGRGELELLVEDALNADPNAPIVEELLITGKVGDGFIAESEKRIRKLLPKMDEHALLRLLICLRLSSDVGEHGEPERLAEIAKTYGIDVVALKKAHEAERTKPVEPTPDPATQPKPEKKSKKKTKTTEVAEA